MKSTVPFTVDTNRSLKQRGSKSARVIGRAVKMRLVMVSRRGGGHKDEEAWNISSNDRIM